MSSFTVVKKAPSHQKKFVLEKKSFLLVFADKIFKTVCGNFRKDKWVSRYLTFGDFTALKNCSLQQNY